MQKSRGAGAAAKAAAGCDGPDEADNGPQQPLPRRRILRRTSRQTHDPGRQAPTALQNFAR